jgi:hypothetical protein
MLPAWARIRTTLQARDHPHHCSPFWEEDVPDAVAAQIVERGLLGYDSE